MQKHTGVLLPAQPGLPSHPVQWSLEESPEPRFTAVFISLEQRQGVGKGWLAAGVSWYLLIGQSLSLWLARVIISLIGQSYHLSDWPELPSPEAREAWLRDYFWPSAPLWACHGSGEVVTSIMPSRFTHVVKNGRISFFLWLKNIPLCVYVYTFYNNETCYDSLLEYVTVLILFQKYWLSTCLALCSWGCLSHRT